MLSLFHLNGSAEGSREAGSLVEAGEILLMEERPFKGDPSQKMGKRDRERKGTFN
jgi:hypothetical protein